MYSLQFPDIFARGKTNMVQDKEAALSNLKLTLGAAKQTLLGDPYFGTNLRKYTFSQNSQVLRDLITDEIYTSIRIFVPQILCRRNDISIKSNGTKLSAEIKFRYITDYTLDMYQIDLLEQE